MNPKDVQQYLRGCQFPCDRKSVEKAIKRNDAPQEVIDGVRQLPERQFKNAADVQQQFEQTETPSQVR